MIVTIMVIIISVLEEKGVKHVFLLEVGCKELYAGYPYLGAGKALSLELAQNKDYWTC